MGLPKPILSYDLRSDARGYELQQNQYVWLCGNTVFKDIPREMWIYDATSLVTDNNSTVLKPNSLLDTEPGRYLYQWTEVPVRRTETYSGVSNASGNYVVNFVNAFSAIPNVQPQPINPDLKDFCRVTAVSTTGFTINIQRRTDIAGLLPTYAAVTNAPITVLVTATT